MERILRAAGKLFAEKGYLGAGVRDLEEAVGIRRGALYYHIESKERLLFELTYRFSMETNELAWAIVGTTASPEDKLRNLARALMRKIVNESDTMLVFFREWIWLKGERRAEILASRDKLVEAVELILREGVDNSGWVDRGPLVMKGVLGMLAYIHVWYEDSDSEVAEELADTFVDTLLLGLEPRDDPS